MRFDLGWTRTGLVCPDGVDHGAKGNGQLSAQQPQISLRISGGGTSFPVGTPPRYISQGRSSCLLLTSDKKPAGALKMSQNKVPPGLEHFSRLNQSIWYHQPTSKTPSSDPDVVLLFGWMDAQPRHIAKYAASYEKLYPSASILAITTSSYDAALALNSANVQRVSPALEVLYALPPNAKLLLHFFSNGGGFTGVLLAKSYKKKMGKSLPATAIILDSMPGRVRLQAQVRAFMVALPKNVALRAIATLILYITFPLYKLRYWLTGQLDDVEQIRLELNDKSLFDLDTPRMYVYSHADDMVEETDVEEHANEAEKLGFTVAREKFLTSGHAAHMIEDPKRYWGAVQNLWAMVS
jgi:Eukaryotic protein of unknown function (DUF829)